MFWNDKPRLKGLGGGPPQSSPSGGLRGDKNGFLPLRTPPKGREEGVPFRAGAYETFDRLPFTVYCLLFLAPTGRYNAG